MSEIDTILDQIAKRAKERISRLDVLVESEAPKQILVKEIGLFIEPIGSTDIPALVAALRRAMDTLRKYGPDAYEEQKIASILSGKGET